jgi:RimJ/RimL family protein N-acetyltransferase
MNWAVEGKRGEGVQGTIGIFNIDESFKTCKLGCWYGKQFWGQGLATEVGKALIDYLFGTLGFTSVHSEYQVDNIGSAKVHAKLGFDIIGGSFCPCIALGLNAVKTITVAITFEKWKSLPHATI